MDITESDRRAFERLVADHGSALCAIAYAVLRDRGRSEECAQEALLVAWRDRDKAPSPITTAWVCAIARNLARNAARRRQELPMVDEPASSTLDARDELIADEDIARANAALAALPERYREAVVLHYRHDQSMAEVASALGISEASARQRVHRGRTQLRERLAPVEATLRATRPSPAFAAAVLAAWALGKTSTASAATVHAVSASAKTAASIGGGLAALALTGVGTYAAVRTANAQRDGAKTSATATRSTASPSLASPSPAPASRAALVRRFPAMLAAHHAMLPAGATAVAAAPTAEGLAPGSAFVDFDFKNAPVAGLAGIIAHALSTPIWVVMPADAVVPSIHVEHADALAALDQALATVQDMRASRTEVAALRIVPGGRSDAAALGGEPIDITVSDAPFDDVLARLQPALGMPIGRFSDDPDDNPTVTLDVHDVPAGAVLQAALDQNGLGYELTTGFVIAPDD